MVITKLLPFGMTTSDSNLQRIPLLYFIMSKRFFISEVEINNNDLKELCNNALAPQDFDDEKCIPIKKLGSVFVAELFHGPTFCFKDLG